MIKSFTDTPKRLVWTPVNLDGSVDAEPHWALEYPMLRICIQAQDSAHQHFHAKHAVH